MVPSIKTIAIILVVMVLIVIIDTIYKRLKPWIIGRRGEVMVALRLMFLCRNRYKVINDVLLKTPWGSSQIDHVIVSLYGIFVLETKTYEGTIYGGDNSEKWTQFFKKRKYELINPVKQNASHIKTLKALVNKDVPYHSLIVFSNKTNVKSNAENALITDCRNIVSEIKKIKDECLTVDQMEEIYDKIKRLNINSVGQRMKHIQNTKVNIKRREFAISENNCPECGAKLTKRKSEYGEYLGCSNYPKCNYTHKFIS